MRNDDNGWDKEPPTNPRMRAYTASVVEEGLPKAVGRHERTLAHWKYLNVGLVLATLMAVGGFYHFVMASAAERADAGVAKATSVERDLKEHIQDSKAQNTEVRQDVKAVYQFLLTRQRQSRFERPARAEVTGSTPDGGQ